MKFTQPIFLLTLSIASALTLFADAAPSSSSSLKNRSLHLPGQEGVRLAASISTRQKRPQHQKQQQKRGGLSSPSAFKAVVIPARAPTTTTTPKSKNSSSVKRLAKDSVSASKIDRRRQSGSSKATTQHFQQQHPHQKEQKLRQRSSSSGHNNKNSNDENRVSAAASTSTSEHKKRRESTTTKKRALLPPATPPAPPSFRKRAATSVNPPSRKAAAVPSKPVRKTRSPATRRLPLPKKNTPLLILPDSHSVWQTGSYQTVRWNRKYTNSLPADTTVDIVLIDSKTNKKVTSLKRFVPFKKGGSQVWVPTNIPEGASFVLVLELYRGRSQESVTSTASASSLSSSNDSAAAPAKAGSPYRYHKGGQEQQGGNPSDAAASTGSGNSNSGGSVSSQGQQPTAAAAATTTADVLSRIVRRSDINIAPAASKRDITRYPPGSYSNSNSNPNSYDNVNNNGRTSNPPSKSATGSHHDINHDDFYTGASQERSMEFLPDELRQEYPNTLRPLTLEHTFGLHQKVYTLTPYTLEWKIPERVMELLEYTRQAQTLFNSISKGNAYSQASASALYPKSTFQAKVLVEIIKDETTESVSVLAKDVPAETMFQYLSIQDRLPPAFYRLRVQMAVVQVRTDFSALTSNNNVPTATVGGSAGKSAMEGWEFPEGGEVIDRYEAITRRFWISQGAL